MNKPRTAKRLSPERDLRNELQPVVLGVRQRITPELEFAARHSFLPDCPAMVLSGGHPVEAALWVIAVDEAIKNGTLALKKKGRRTTVEFGGLSGDLAIGLSDFRRITTSASRTLSAGPPQPSGTALTAGASQAKSQSVSIVAAWRTLSGALDYLKGVAEDHSHRQLGSGPQLTPSPRAGVTWYAVQEAVTAVREAISITRRLLPQAKAIKEGLLPDHMRWKNIATGLLDRIEGMLRTDIPARAGQPRVTAGRLLQTRFDHAAFANLQHQANELGVALENDLPVPRPKSQRTLVIPDGFRKLRWVISAMETDRRATPVIMAQLEQLADKLPESMFFRVGPRTNRYINVRELVKLNKFRSYREILLRALDGGEKFSERKPRRKTTAKRGAR